MNALRRRLEQSALLARILAAGVGSYLSFCNRTIRWHVSGQSALAADLANGPVLLVCWHGRSLMAPIHWPVTAGPLSSLHDASPIGRVSGALQRRMGLRPIEMARGASNRAASRIILRHVRDGVSIGMTGDGPLGPAGQVQDAPLDWARVTGMPVWGYAFSCSRARRLNTWDAMLMPRPFGNGAIVFERWNHDMPRKVTDLDTHRLAMATLLDDVSAQADAHIAR